VLENKNRTSPKMEGGAVGVVFPKFVEPHGNRPRDLVRSTHGCNRDSQHEVILIR